MKADDLKIADWVTALPVERLAQLKLVGVNPHLLEDAKGESLMAERAREAIAALLPGGMGAWIRVGTLSEDQSGWCEVEGKWEYYYRDEVIFAPKAELTQALADWEKTQGLTHNPFRILANKMSAA